MDAALLAEREAFKRRAMAVPTIENKKKKVTLSNKEIIFRTFCLGGKGESKEASTLQAKLVEAAHLCRTEEGNGGQQSVQGHMHNAHVINFMLRGFISQFLI